MVEDHLGEGAHVSQFFVLHAQVFPRVYNFLPLVLDDGLVLVPDHLLFFLKVSHDLCQTLLEDLNFVFVGLDFVALHGRPLGVLLLSPQVDGDVPLNLPVVVLLLLDFLLVLLELVPLRDGLECETLVLLVNLPLDSLNSCTKRLGPFKFTYFSGLLGLLFAGISQAAPRIRFRFQASFGRGRFDFRTWHE